MKIEYVELGDVLEYEQPTKYIVKNTNYNDDFKTPVLTAGQSFILGYTNENENIFNNIPVIIFDDFTTANKYVDFQFKVKSSAMKILKADSKRANIRYLFYLIQTIKVNCEQHKRYWISKFSKLKIPLPPLDEQKRIAHLLDQADKLRQLNTQLIQKYEALTQSLFLEMFGDNKNRYEEIELGSIIKLIGGGTPSKEREEYWNGNIPWASVKDLKSDKLYNTKDFITKQGVENSSTKIAPKGSLIIATRMAVGRCAICETDIAINQDLKAIEPSDNINTTYLHSLFKSKENYFNLVATGATVKGIKIQHITKLKVNLPPLDLQSQFAERVAIIEQQKQQAQDALQKSEDLFHGLLQDVFGK